MGKQNIQAKESGINDRDLVYTYQQFAQKGRFAEWKWSLDSAACLKIPVCKEISS